MSKNIEERIEKTLSDGAKVALVLCANAFRFGGNWGYLTQDSEELKGYLETLKTERQHVKAFRVSNGALVLVNENFLASNVNAVVPNAITGSFVEKAKQRRREEQERFNKFLKNVVSGKSKYTKNAKGNFALTLGIFSVNETNSIRLNGQEYPAYKITLIEALEFLNQLTKEGYKVYVHAVKEDGTSVYDTPFNLGSNSKGIQAVYRGLEISDTKTGVFLKIVIQK